jgi:hypothetical protein
MSDFVIIEGNEFRISALAGMKKAEFVEAYTGVVMDVQKTWKGVEKYAKRKPVSVDESE